jgi:HAD superfamily hydrolase (TIGR01509 family)
VTQPAAVVFDMDGVLLDSETVWNDARRELVERSGGRWRDDAQRAMMGMSSVEWAGYMHDELGVPAPAEEISAAVVAELERRYREALPLIDGARDAVVRTAARWQLGLASSANRPVIELALREAELIDCFAATVSSEEVARGKPAPDVYLDVARRLGADPEACVAVEDSSNGLRSAAAAGMGVIAVPNREFPPDDDAVALADVRLDSIGDLVPEDVEEALSRRA